MQPRLKYIILLTALAGAAVASFTHLVERKNPPLSISRQSQNNIPTSPNPSMPSTASIQEPIAAPSSPKTASLPPETWALLTDPNPYRSITNLLSKNPSRGLRTASNILLVCTIIEQQAKSHGTASPATWIPKTNQGKLAMDALITRCANLPMDSEGDYYSFFKDRFEQREIDYPLSKFARAGFPAEDLKAIMLTGDPSALEYYYEAQARKAKNASGSSNERWPRYRQSFGLASAIAQCDIGLDRCDEANSADFRVLHVCAKFDLCDMTRRQQLLLMLRQTMPTMPAGAQDQLKAMEEKLITSIRGQLTALL